MKCNFGVFQGLQSIIKNLRLGYQEPRAQRVQRRREEIENELKRKEEEDIIRSRAASAV